MTTVRYSDGQLLRARVALASEIDRRSVALPSRVVEAFLNVDRHPFVPVFYREDPNGLHRPWWAGEPADEGWLREVYTDQVLVTEVDEVHAEAGSPNGQRGVPTSSSTLPSLMADMLDALDVRPGDRVLEVGTGTGYNTALLCHLAGGAQVTTIDRTERLVATARARLCAVGFEPTVLRADGADGHPAGAPYDRIIATCGIQRLPRAWLDQCAPGGLIVAPIRGAVARLTKLSDGRAVGRFLHRPAAFMPLRSGAGPGPEAPEWERERPTGISFPALDDPGFSFWVGLHLGGSRDFRETVEAAHRSWLDQNRPRREWFTIEAGPDGHVVSYAAPDGTSFRWVL
ncbi:methyltransferase domain-containing protein [Kitasatospora sp. NPDC059146]|uniref:methyltransferase domain-containing protein n=1 Tax=Kitasatospora sp. NPDC059146 TaxID=3346741 RepID=UPI003687B1A0